MRRGPKGHLNSGRDKGRCTVLALGNEVHRLLKEHICARSIWALMLVWPNLGRRRWSFAGPTGAVPLELLGNTVDLVDVVEIVVPEGAPRTIEHDSSTITIYVSYNRILFSLHRVIESHSNRGACSARATAHHNSPGSARIARWIRVLGSNRP